MLANKTYIGDLEKGNTTRSARVFSDGRDAVAVIYSDSCAAYRLPAGIEFKAAYGIDGRALPLFDGAERALSAHECKLWHFACHRRER